MKRLIVTADDVGLHRGMTAGAIRAHREGIVTACSVVANGRAFEDAVARLRDVPALEVGVHLTLVEETPLTDIRAPKKWPSFLPLYFAGAIGNIEGELRAQVERVSSRLPVTHLNGHQHLHVLPGIFAIVEKIAADHGIRYIRRVNDRGGRAGIARRAAVAALSALGRRARGTNDRTIGVKEAGHLTDIEPLLDHVDGLTELVTHPGLGVDGYAGWGYDWDRETAALCDPALREAVAQRGITLTAPAAAG